MKKIILFCIILSLFTTSCKDTGPVVEENGLTKNINDIVPQSIIDEMESLDMPIYTGPNPPNIGIGTTGKSYLASPFILVSSNITNDTPGRQFGDYYLKLYDQNSDDLTIKLTYLNSDEEGTGLGGYIVGDNNKFSIFAEVNSTYKNSNDEVFSAILIHVISGTWTSSGIKDLYFANFMIDNNENIGGYWIENGEGRVIYDSDGLSETISSFDAPQQKIKKPGAALMRILE